MFPRAAITPARSAVAASCVAVVVGCGRPDAPSATDATAADTSAGGVPERVRAAIRADEATRWVFEVDAVGGRALEAGTVTAITEALGALVDKPDGVEFVADDTVDGALLWTDASLAELAEATFDDAGGPGTLTSHVLLLDGLHVDGDVLGASWAHTHVALFTDVLALRCEEGPGDADRVCPAVERGVLLHEIGHLLGLVDAGLPMVVDHEDPEHPHHDRDPDCLMFWAYERDALVQHVQRRGDAPDLGFDASCVADLDAVRLR